MILPGKHVSVSRSILNAGAALLQNIDGSQTVTMLWDEARAWPEVGTFERFTLGLDMLFAIGLVRYRDGLLERAGP